MYDVILIGSGMGSLSAAALLVNKGLKTLILEQNWIPGGCTTSYPRKGYVFEAGATTLVGLDENMPLRFLLDQTGIELKARKLDLPMQVHLSDGSIINRYQDIAHWIKEAEKHFGGNQEAFWKQAYKLSKFVWNASTRFRQFPPNNFYDYLSLLKQARLSDFGNSRFAFHNTTSILKSHSLLNDRFLQFIDEQLLITAQNYSDEVNFLFGASALCYTNYGNYYIDGGLNNLVTPITEFIERNNGEIKYREGVDKVDQKNDHYEITTKHSVYKSKFIISGVPVNNLQNIAPSLIAVNHEKKILGSDKLYSAFQMGIVFKSEKNFLSLHHQIHLKEPLPETGSKSIFLSLNHPEDITRGNTEGIRIASVSTHISNPESTFINPDLLERTIVKILVEKGFIEKPDDIIYSHSSGPKSWNKWTKRAYGFVGGYPQYFKTKPWQMIGSRLNSPGVYQCGDSTYPGQGIPGVTLSGIIAAEKLLSDFS